MHIISKETRRKLALNFHGFELHKVYQSMKDNCFYMLVKISYDKGKSFYNCLFNLNTMEGYRMCDLIAKNEFIEVDYQFEVKD